MALDKKNVIAACQKAKLEFKVFRALLLIKRPVSVVYNMFPKGIL